MRHFRFPAAFTSSPGAHSSAVPALGFCDIKETLLPQLYAAGERVLTYESGGATPRVLDASTYRAVNEWMVEQLVSNGADQAGYVKRGSALVHSDASIADDATIVGPVLVGPGARIMAGAVVIGPISIGREAKIGRGAVVSRSAVWRRSVIGDHAIVDQCIVADDAVVDAQEEICGDVVLTRRDANVNPDWVTRQIVHVPKRQRMDAATKLARLVFGGTWSRSPAPQ